MLSVKTTGPAYVKPSRLVLNIDRERISLADPQPESAGAACPEESGSNLGLPSAGQQPSCVYEEVYWFRATPELMIRLANANEVIVHLEGGDGSIQRRFTARNFESFQAFVAGHVS